jgi:hypothetical protein
MYLSLGGEVNSHFLDTHAFVSVPIVLGRCELCEDVSVGNHSYGPRAKRNKIKNVRIGFRCTLFVIACQKTHSIPACLRWCAGIENGQLHNTGLAAPIF